jgi:CTP synthase (UTP-ammonia lyase)
MNQPVKVGVIGDYDPNLRYHIATDEALGHAATALSVSLTSSWIPTQSLAQSNKFSPRIALILWRPRWRSP